MSYIVGGYHDACIRSIDIDTNEIKKVSKYANTSYMYVDNDFIYSIVRINELAGIIKISKSDMKVSSINVHESIPSCYVSKFAGLIFSCNYHLGTLNVYDEHLSLLDIIKFKDNSKIHCVNYNDGYYYVCDLANDCIYKLDNNLLIVDTIVFDNHCGPRHIIFDNDIMYVACELSNELIVLSKEVVIKRIKLTDVVNASVAAIKQDKEYIYISVRGINQIFIINKDTYCVDKVLDTYGKDPRDFIVDDNMIIVVHQNSSNITVFKDKELYESFIGGEFIYINRY